MQTQSTQEHAACKRPSFHITTVSLCFREVASGPNCGPPNKGSPDRRSSTGVFGKMDSKQTLSGHCTRDVIPLSSLIALRFIALHVVHNQRERRAIHEGTQYKSTEKSRA